VQGFYNNPQEAKGDMRLLVNKIDKWKIIRGQEPSLKNKST
jgi:hypothetical protein